MLRHSSGSEPGISRKRVGRYWAYFDAGGNRITDRSLEHLAGCPTLRTLHAASTKLTDTGLSHLHPCKGLQFVDVSKTFASPEGVEKLRQALPNCEVKADELRK